jgi:hypothetical protein
LQSPRDPPAAAGSDGEADDGGSGSSGLPSRPVPAALWTRLGGMKVLLDCVVPCAPEAFLPHFIADAAPFSLAEFYRLHQGCENITISPWNEEGTNGDAAGSSEGGEGPGGGTPAARASEDLLVTRNIRFRMPLNAGPFAPKETRVEKVQSLAQYAIPLAADSPKGQGQGQGDAEGLLLAIEASSRSLDVPFGDSFTTQDTWLVVPVDADVPVLGLGRATVKHKAAVQEAAQLAAKWATAAAFPSHAASAAAGKRHARKASGGSAAQPDSDPHACVCRVVVLLSITFSKSFLLKGKVISSTESALIKLHDKWAKESKEYLRTAGAAAAARGPKAVHRQSLRLGQRRGSHEGTIGHASAGDGSGLRPLDTSVDGTPVGRFKSMHGTSMASPGGGSIGSVLSPTLGAALRNKDIHFEHDELMRTLLSPQAAKGATRDVLYTEYVRLYASHEALIMQTRRSQRDSQRFEPESGASGSEKVDASFLSRLFAWIIELIQDNVLKSIIVSVCVAVFAMFAFFLYWRIVAPSGAIDSSKLSTGAPGAPANRLLDDIRPLLQELVDEAVRKQQ